MSTNEEIDYAIQVTDNFGNWVHPKKGTWFYASEVAAMIMKKDKQIKELEEKIINLNTELEYLRGFKERIYRERNIKEAEKDGNE